jgi:predicted regulator of Ras-like GTPase activity (Roadblock/LC7/MglB family)
MFDDALQAVRAGADGVLAVVLAGLDGMVVAALPPTGDGPAADVLAASFVEIYKKVGATYRDAGLAMPVEITVQGAGSTVAVRAVTSEYLLMALFDPTGIAGQVRFELRRAAGRLQPELL